MDDRASMRIASPLVDWRASTAETTDALVVEHEGWSPPESNDAMTDDDKESPHLDSDPFMELSPATPDRDSGAAMSTMVGKKNVPLGLAHMSPLPGARADLDPSIWDDESEGEFGAETDVFKSNQVIDNRYVLEEQLGQGGMGCVYSALCKRLGKRFAIKRMHKDLEADVTLRELFYREARLASSLAHPNIVSVVDYGEDPDVGAFMVMELVKGEPLTKRFANGSVPMRTTCELVLQIADALHYIHGKGIVHGDIKPDNILLNRVHHSDKRRWDVTLLDFGLARMDKAERARDGRISGTPPYMAPERIKGASPEPRQDLYSLGVLGYQLITGHLPFDGTVDEVLDGHLHKEPPPFSQYIDERQYERIEQLIRKALAKAPGDRHPDMAAFIYELRTVVDMLDVGNTRARFKKSVTLVPTVAGASADFSHAALGFELCRLPAAVLQGDGTISTANAAFARFVGEEKQEELRGTSVFSKRLSRYHPTLADDLDEVRESRQSLKRKVQVRKGAQNTTLHITLTPHARSGGPILLLVQTALDT